MTDSLRIDSGTKRLLINDGPTVIEFDPSDIAFAERFYQMVRDFELKQKEFSEQAEKIEATDDAAKYPETIKLARGMCEFIRARIDILLGDGTSQKIFGDTLSMSMIQQFFEGFMPYIQTAREQKIKQYTPHPKAKRKVKVMMP